MKDQKFYIYLGKNLAESCMESLIHIIKHYGGEIIDNKKSIHNADYLILHSNDNKKEIAKLRLSPTVKIINAYVIFYICKSNLVDYRYCHAE